MALQKIEKRELNPALWPLSGSGFVDFSLLHTLIVTFDPSCSSNSHLKPCYLQLYFGILVVSRHSE
jgi:hypothetical protein